MLSMFLRKCVKESGLELQEVAKRARMNYNHLSGLLSGSRKWPRPYETDIYEKLAPALEIEVAVLEARAHDQQAYYLEEEARNHRELGKVARESVADYEE